MTPCKNSIRAVFNPLDDHFRFAAYFLITSLVRLRSVQPSRWAGAVGEAEFLRQSIVWGQQEIAYGRTASDSIGCNPFFTIEFPRLREYIAAQSPQQTANEPHPFLCIRV